MKDCEKIHPLLPLYADGALSATEKSRLALHLKACASARKELEQFSRLAQSLKRLPEPEFPAGLHAKIMDRIGSREKPGSLFDRLWTRTSMGLAAAAVVALLLFVQSPDLMKGPSNLAPSSKPSGEPAGNLPPAGSLAGQGLSAPKGLDSLQRNRLSSKDEEKESTAGSFAPQPAPSGANPRGLAQSDAETSREPSAKTAAGYSTQAVAPPSAAPMAEKAPIGAAMKKVRSSAANVSLPNVGEAQESDLSNAGPSPPLSSWSGDNGPATLGQALVTDAETFKERWETLNPNQPVPVVNFTQQVVVLIEAGEEPTAGYSVQVTRLEEQAGQWVVHYQVAAPGGNQAPILTHPWVMKVVPKPDKSVVFTQDP